MTDPRQPVPCPFCGNPGTRDPRHTFSRDEKRRRVAVCCGRCGCIGPWARDIARDAAPGADEALRLWNTRV